jgi:hypothetical protein
MVVPHRITAMAVALLLSVFPLVAAAGQSSLSQPQGIPLLTITGAITETNIDGSAQFDTDLFTALPRHKTTTSTPWYDAPRTFEGPLLRDVLAAVGATGKMLRVEALNDYAALIPVSDVIENNVILADRIDGKPIPVRERGPLFIIYPFDERPALNAEEYYQRSVWQVRSIEVQP